MIENSPNHALLIFNSPFCTKEKSYFAHWKFNKQFKKFGYQAFNEYSADKFHIACISKIWNLKNGVSDVNFEI